MHESKYIQYWVRVTIENGAEFRGILMDVKTWRVKIADRIMPIESTAEDRKYYIYTIIPMPKIRAIYFERPVESWE